jgi:two-component system, NtrC family, sensor kinase
MRDLNAKYNYLSIIILTILFSCIGLQIVYAQSLQGKALADSLVSEIPKTKTDTDKVKLMIRTGRVLASKDTLSAIQYTDSAMRLSKQLQWTKGVGLSYMNKAKIYNVTSVFAMSIENAANAYEIFKSENWISGMGDALALMAINFEKLGDYTKAIESNFKALSIYEELSMEAEIAWIYNNLGADYYKLRDYSNALENYNKALTLQRKLGNKFGIASALDNIASVYEDQGDFKMVNEYNSQAIKLFEEINDQPALGRIYINRGNYSQRRNNFDSALIYYNKAIRIALKLDIKRTLAFGYGGIGDLYFNLMRNGYAPYNIPDSLKLRSTMLLQRAYDYYSRALGFSLKVGDLSLMMQYSQSLSETEVLRGNYKAALSLYRQSTQYKDSIFNDDNKAKLAALEKNRVAEVKDKEIQLLNKEKALQASEQEKKDAETKRVKNIQYFTIVMLGIVTLAVLIIALLQFRNIRHRREANILLQQQKEKVEHTLTELKAAQTQIIHAEKMASLGELTAGIAHEIQNPLNFMNNFSEVNRELIEEMEQEIRAGNLDNVKTFSEDIKKNEERISQHGKRADAIIKRMLLHSRTNVGHIEVTDINSLVDEYLNLTYQGFRAKWKNFNSTVKTDLDPTIGGINTVPQDIGRVLLNLYNNAFYAVSEKKKHHAEGYEPTVSVSTKKINDKVEIRVRDNGNGIPHNVKDRIFQPFFTTKPAGQGTGLGLSLSYDIIKVHGGEIKVETQEGEFTEFLVQIPAV